MVSRAPGLYQSTVSKDALIRFALRPAAALLLRRPRRRVALERPQGPLNVADDRLALLVDRLTLRGQHLPVFPQVFQLLHHVLGPGQGGLAADRVLEEFAQPLP